MSASSNTGAAVAESLLRRGTPIRVTGRDAARLSRFQAAGAQVAPVAAGDAAGLAAALDGATAAFVMLAPGLLPESEDFAAYQREVIAAVEKALQATRSVRTVVGLSGWAANFPGARGPVWGLHRFEQALGRVAESGVAVTSLRPGWFMENALPMISELTATGVTRGVIPPDRPLPMVATSDIGEVAADILTGAREPVDTLELQGPADLTLAEATAVIARRAGLAEARYERIDAAQLRAGLLAAGFTAHMAEGVTDMSMDVAEGRIRMLRPRGPQTATPTTFEEFVAARPDPGAPDGTRRPTSDGGARR
jgi:uncharacterized protein YbjT (DUF2867 family)